MKKLVVLVADPIAGTWELNLAKSTYNSGRAPKNETRTFEMVGDTLKYSAKGLDPDGKPMLRQVVAKFTQTNDGYDATGKPVSDVLVFDRR